MGSSVPVRWFCRFNETLPRGRGSFRGNSLQVFFLRPRCSLIPVRQGRRRTSTAHGRWYIGPIPRSPRSKRLRPLLNGLDEIAKVIDSFLMAVSCTLSPSHFVRFSFSTQMSRVQPSRRNRNATKLETDKEGAPAGIRIYNNRSFGGPAWWWQVWFIRGNLVAIYDDRVNRLRVTSISVTGMAADNSRTCVSFHRSLTAMVTRCCERRNQDYMNIWTLVAI